MRIAPVAAVALLATPSLADEPPKTPGPPAPKLALSVTDRGPGRPWRLRIRNEGTSPVQVSTDPRLLWFDVDVPGSKKPVTCRLPSGLFPNRVERPFSVVLEHDKAFAFEFDPRLYCFASGRQSTLVPGALLHPHFGWPEKQKKVWKKGRLVEEKLEQLPPFAVEPADEDDPVAKVKQLDGKTFALRSNYSGWSSVAILPKEGEGEGEDAPPLRMTMTRGSDAGDERNAVVTVRLKNRSKQALSVYFRRELVSFEIMGPDGLVVCNPEPDDRAPDPQAFLSMRPGRVMTITSRLVELCPRGTFGRPGLYLINAWLDAGDPGHRFGIDGFTGRIVTRAPAAVRVRTGTKPFLKQWKWKRRVERRVNERERKKHRPPPLSR